MCRDRGDAVAPARVLLHPVVLIALVAWLVNDHVAKYAWPGSVTGKLSDVAGLIVFPLVPLAAWEYLGGSRTRTRRSVIVASVVVTGAMIAAINLFEVAATGYRWGLATAQWPLRALSTGTTALHPVHLTMDATDLFTLPALLVPLWLTWARGYPARCRR